VGHIRQYHPDFLGISLVLAPFVQAQAALVGSKLGFRATSLFVEPDRVYAAQL
jgi:hypothetical protein